MGRAILSFLVAWFLQVKAFFNLIAQIAIQHLEFQVGSIIWSASMWKIRGEIQNRPKNTLEFENWIDDDNFSEAFSVFWF